MPATVRLNDIVDALEMQFDESSSFLDRDTGQVETVSHVLLREAEESGDAEEPELPTWQKQEWEAAKRIVSTDHFQKLPTKFEVHEWAIMQDFSRSVESDRIREDLLHAIHGARGIPEFQGDPGRERSEGQPGWAPAGESVAEAHGLDASGFPATTPVGRRAGSAARYRVVDRAARRGDARPLPTVAPARRCDGTGNKLFHPHRGSPNFDRAL